jgi:hypothetical protein
MPIFIDPFERAITADQGCRRTRLLYKDVKLGLSASRAVGELKKPRRRRHEVGGNQIKNSYSGNWMAGAIKGRQIHRI